MTIDPAHRGARTGVVPREIATAVSGLEFLTALRDEVHPPPPFAGVANIWISEVEKGRVLFEALPSARFYNPLGTVHGGWISTLLDSAMGCAVHSSMPAGQIYTTVDMTISFVRPVIEQTGKLRCEGNGFGFGSDRTHGGAVVPSFTTRYRWATIRPMINPGTRSMCTA